MIRYIALFILKCKDWFCFNAVTSVKSKLIFQFKFFLGYTSNLIKHIGMNFNLDYSSGPLIQDLPHQTPFLLFFWIVLYNE